MFKSREQPGDDPEAVRELVCFTAIHWRVARRSGVHPDKLTPGYLARRSAEDLAAFEAQCAALGLALAPQSQIDEAAQRARHFFVSCLRSGTAPGVL